MGLRVEEHLGVDHALGGRPLEIGQGELVEVLLGDEHGAAGVVEVEEGLEVGEDVGLPHGFDVGVGQVDAVAVGQGEHHLRLERAFDVEVELGLGQLEHEAP